MNYMDLRSIAPKSYAFEQLRISLGFHNYCKGYRKVIFRGLGNKFPYTCMTLMLALRLMFRLGYNMIRVRAAAMMLVLCSCTSSDKGIANSEVRQNYRQMSYLVQSDVKNESQLLSVYRNFAKYDEQSGIWQSSLMLSAFYLRKATLSNDFAVKTELTKKARDYGQLSLAAGRRTKQAKQLYESYVQLFLLSGQSDYLNKAQSYASTEFMLNKLYYLSADFANIMPLLDEGEATLIEQAYVSYWIAKREHNMVLAQQAYQFFKQVEHSIGLGDSLYLMAKIISSSDRHRARDYANRALAVFSSLENTAAQNKIVDWINEYELAR
jgi:hypothetical protein